MAKTQATTTRRRPVTVCSPPTGATSDCDDEQDDEHAATAFGGGHLASIADLTAADITSLLDRAELFCPIARGEAPGIGTLRGRIIANLFLENSTRTRCSFAIAALRLGAQSLDLLGSGSSMSKGETLLDTVRTVEAMSVDAIVLRCSDDRGPHQAAEVSRVPIINGGDGTNEHPTQALLDALTLRQRLGRDLAGKRIGIVGDVVHSRVAGSNTLCLPKLGATVVLIAPKDLAPSDTDLTSMPGVEVAQDLDEQLPTLDAIMMLRVQFERGGAIGDDYRNHFALTAQRASRLPEHAPVLHPGPMNRGLEIADAVADDAKRSVIHRQINNGIATRMAVLERLLLRSVV